MIEVICTELSDGQNVRANLIELRQKIKETGVLDEWQSYHCKHPVLYAFLSDEDAKVRKNAALLLGVTDGNKAVDALYEAYEAEEKLFVKSAYLTAMCGLSVDDYAKKLQQRYDELLHTELQENEKKHVKEELHALDKLICGTGNRARHKFTGYEQEAEVLLITNPMYRELTAEQITKARPSLVPAGVKVTTTDLRELMAIRTYREMLFVLSGSHHVEADPKAAAEAFLASNLLEFLDRMHEGGGTFYFRIEIKSRMTADEKSRFVRQMADTIEEQSSYRLMNSTDAYELELRLILSKDGTFYPVVKLYTIPMRRFSYRKQAIAASIHPSSAALLMRLAKPYLKESAQVLDPFCGVGTMLIERDLLVPAGDMYGTDIFGEAILKARENALAAGRAVNYINRDFFDFTHKYLFDELVTNMPVRGKKSKEEQDDFYGRFFDRAASFLKADGVIILYSNEYGFVKKQLRLHKEYRLINEFCIRKKDGFYLFIISIKR